MMRGVWGNMHWSHGQQCLDRSLDTSSLDAPAATLWSLPDEVLVHLLTGINIKDLLNLRTAHSRFCDLIDSNSRIWTNATFHGLWPTLPNIRHFEKAAQHNSLESLIKLGIAYLYNEGLPGDFEGKKISTNGKKAASLFCKVEDLCYTTGRTSPFTWLFIRPPWTSTGACCKERVFSNMMKYFRQSGTCPVGVCVAKIVEMLYDDPSHPKAVDYLTEARNRGSVHAAFYLWQMKYSQQGTCAIDVGNDIQSIRELRDIASHNHLDAKLTLCRAYACGRYGGLSALRAAGFVREVFAESLKFDVQSIFLNTELTPTMRYILLDWLVEVTSMKDFNSLTLHVAISIVDRYLLLRPTPRSRLQLLGVSAMVLSSRYLGKDIITIREAAWLTDNTYKYEDVVRMMAEITSALRGNIRVRTILDYVRLLGCLTQNDTATQMMAEYITELVILQTQLSQYEQAQLAASSVLLARLAMKKEYPWPDNVKQFTGMGAMDLSECVLMIHKKCFGEDPMKDHRKVTLQSVKVRYSDEKYLDVSSISILDVKELKSLLGLKDESRPLLVTKRSIEVTQQLIMSPSRTRSTSYSDNLAEVSFEREQAATPSLEKTLSESFSASVLSLTGGHEDTVGMETDESQQESGIGTVWSRDVGDDSGYKVQDKAMTNTSDFSHLFCSLPSGGNEGTGSECNVKPNQLSPGSNNGPLVKLGAISPGSFSVQINQSRISFVGSPETISQSTSSSSGVSNWLGISHESPSCRPVKEQNNTVQTNSMETPPSGRLNDIFSLKNAERTVSAVVMASSTRLQYQQHKVDPAVLAGKISRRRRRKSCHK